MTYGGTLAPPGAGVLIAKIVRKIFSCKFCNLLTNKCFY
jgi:hypothetical protein